VEYTILHWYDHLLQAEPSKIPYSSLSDIVLVAPHRRAWIARYMLLQIAAFPLQTTLEQLRKIHPWLVRGHSNPSETDFDVLEDMFDTIFLLAIGFIGQRAHGIPKLTSSFAHFERMMVT
jgi:hypothetical protein